MAKRASLAGIAILTLLSSGPAHADQAPVIEIDHPIGRQPPAVVPTRAVEASALPAANILPTARIGALGQLEAMKAWNAAGLSPVQNGFTRRLPSTLPARLDSTPGQDGGRALLFETSLGDRIWTTSIQIDQADRMRLHLEKVNVQPGTLFTIWGAGDAPRTFGIELLGPGGDIWTPSVSGERVFLEVRFPKPGRGANDGFEIRDVAQIFLDVPLAGECLIDATCVSASLFAPIESLRKAIAHIEFIKDSGIYACSGGLLNDTDVTTIVPYFLTANHCISSQAVASTLEAFWDYKTSTCGGTFPNLGTLPRSTGATLLATSVQSDFALLRLLAIPAGRTLLGWSSDVVASGTLLTRLSHPIPAGAIFPQSFSAAIYTTSPAGTCRTDSDGRPWGDLSKFLYSAPATGGIYGGSSGSPVVNPAGQVVGQLLGLCGTNFEGCSFSTLYCGWFVRQYLLLCLAVSQSCGRRLRSRRHHRVPPERTISSYGSISRQLRQPSRGHKCVS